MLKNLVCQVHYEAWPNNVKICIILFLVISDMKFKHGLFQTIEILGRLGIFKINMMIIKIKYISESDMYNRNPTLYMARLLFGLTVKSFNIA